jgi:hypothetical protein
MAEVTEEIIWAYIQGKLPVDVRLDFVPIYRDGYGEYQIEMTDFLSRPPKLDDDISYETESIRLEEYIIKIVAGYGPKTKTLVVGTEGGTDPILMEKNNET